LIFGYNKKIIKINLTTGDTKVINLKERTVKKLLGGKGIGAALLFKLTSTNLNPLSPENPLIFTVGPAEGLVFPGANRLCAVFKSPLTGFFGESYCGGFLGTELKRSGLDGIIITGKSKKPVYITIFDGEINIHNAEHLWGKDTFETEDIIKKDYNKKVQVACIGPAGENLVKYSCISHRKGRQFGRCGSGAVMGSKKLKAMVISGSQKTEVFNLEIIKDLSREIVYKAKERLKSLSRYGTPSVMMATQATGTLPTRYWQQGSFNGYDKIGPEKVEKLINKSLSCFGCPIACGKITVTKTASVEGPEYETLFALGSLCSIDDLYTIIKANEICDRLGLDTITTGNVIAFLMYLSEKKINTTKKYKNKLKIRFGEEEAISETIQKIAYRREFGDILAEGIKTIAEVVGAEGHAVHIKGLDPPGYDPRGLKAVALSYGVSCRGACHLRHIAHRPGLTGTHPFKPNLKVDRLSYESCAHMVKELEDFYTVIDSMILCKFLCLPGIGPMLWDEITKLFNAITGLNFNTRILFEIGENINDLVRSYNIREGLTKEFDKLPRRWYNESVNREIVDEKKYNEMLLKYYEVRGWNSDGEIQTHKLKDIKQELERIEA
jgi:aldehyde:ferredoxin oxidoreductase